MLDSLEASRKREHGMIEYHVPLRQEYIARINRVTDYIRAHLNGDLWLSATYALTKLC